MCQLMSGSEKLVGATRHMRKLTQLVWTKAHNKSGQERRCYIVLLSHNTFLLEPTIDCNVGAWPCMANTIYFKPHKSFKNRPIGSLIERLMNQAIGG